MFFKGFILLKFDFIVCAFCIPFFRAVVKDKKFCFNYL